MSGPRPIVGRNGGPSGPRDTEIARDLRVKIEELNVLLTEAATHGIVCDLKAMLAETPGDLPHKVVVQGTFLKKLGAV